MSTSQEVPPTSGRYAGTPKLWPNPASPSHARVCRRPGHEHHALRTRVPQPLAPGTGLISPAVPPRWRAGHGARCRSCRVTYVVSTATTTSLGEIAAAADGERWFQLYLLPDASARAASSPKPKIQDAGSSVSTVDTPVAGVRSREQRAQVRLPDGVVAPYFHRIMNAGAMRSSFVAPTWDDVAWLQSISTLPVVLKGILTDEDADRAVRAGVAGVIVSNHGARNLDTVPASIDALPEASAVAGRIPVLLDGGVRRGTDILKSLALGATAVLIGRPYLYGLAVAGAEGVTAVARSLRAELESALALTGRNAVSELDRTVLWDRVGRTFRPHRSAVPEESRPAAQRGADRRHQPLGISRGPVPFASRPDGMRRPTRHIDRW